MPERPLTKKQHYVPRMYLKRWQDNCDKKLFVITKNEKSNMPKVVTVDDELFYQNYCYDIPNPDGTLWTSNEVEKTFGEYEIRHNKLLKRILNRCEDSIDILDKGTNRIEDFLEFVALMVVRNPNNNIPVSIEKTQSSTSDLDCLFREIFGSSWNITGLQVVANSMNKKYLFETVKEINRAYIIPEAYFLSAPDEACFITSDNPVLCHEKWSYIPLSPRYAAFVLYDTRVNCKFQKNRVFQFSCEEVEKFNCLYWKQNDVHTLIGNNQKDLINALGIEVKE